MCMLRMTTQPLPCGSTNIARIPSFERTTATNLSSSMPNLSRMTVYCGALMLAAVGAKSLPKLWNGSRLVSLSVESEALKTSFGRAETEDDAETEGFCAATGAPPGGGGGGAFPELHATIAPTAIATPTDAADRSFISHL